jgi:steroid 5-alpha reductase family enzyme
MYVAAFALGAVLFFTLPIADLVWRTLAIDAAMTLLIWMFGLLVKNSSVYDPYWSVIPPYLLVLVMISTGSTALSVLMMGIAILFWAIRLTYNWMTGWTDFSDQDWRYTMIRNTAPKLWFLSNLFGIMMFPTLIVFAQLVGAIRFIEAAPELNGFILFGSVMIVFAAILQYFADKQMADFKHRNQGKKACIEEGLWKYSRHPNYFGEISVWWGLYLIYFGSIKTLDLVVAAPILMTAMFLFISIPMMEKKILLTRPEYEKYQERVSILIPFFPKHPKNESETTEEKA